MSAQAPLTTLLPVRDTRDRTIAYELRSHPPAGLPRDSIDAEARALLDLVQKQELLRGVRGRALHVPITPGVLRGGAITALASADVVFTLALDALDEDDTRRALERYAKGGFRFGFIGDSLEALAEPRLPAGLQQSTVTFEAYGPARGLVLASAIQRLLEAGARPIARGVDDRATRERLRAGGVVGFIGRTLPRGRAASNDARVRALAVLTMLARFADGRPLEASLDAFITGDSEIGRAVFRATASAAMGTVRPRTLNHALSMLGREELFDRLIVAAAFLLADSAGDPEVAAIAIRRVRTLERLGSAIERTGHPRGHVIAALLSVADVATGMPPAMLADTLAVPPLLRDALVERAQPLGALLDVVEAHESAWWDDCFARAEQIGIAPTVVNDAWRQGWLAAKAEMTARSSPTS
jgi:hypothetical protein